MSPFDTPPPLVIPSVPSPNASKDEGCIEGRVGGTQDDILSCSMKVPWVFPTKKGAAWRPYFLPEECLPFEVTAAQVLDRVVLEPEEIP